MPHTRLWELLARKYNNEISASEQTELNCLLVEHSDAFELNETLTGIRNLTVKENGTDAEAQHSREWIAKMIADEQQEITGNVQEEIADNHSPKKYLLWAALFCGVLIAGAWYFTAASRNNNSNTDKPNEIATGISKSRVNLPDGSVVILNKGSEISYGKDFGQTKREIILKGEGYFDIAKNENVPLVVIAGPVRIKVTGTAFNVRAYAEDSVVETSLFRGAVQVSSTDDPGREILLHPNEKIILGRSASRQSAGASSIGRKEEKPALVLLDKIKPNAADSSINELVWLKDKLVFSHESFYSLSLKMERWYHVKINFKEEAAGKLLVTGSLEKENLEEALEALQQIASFSYSIANNTVTITNKIKTITH